MNIYQAPATPLATTEESLGSLKEKCIDFHARSQRRKLSSYHHLKHFRFLLKRKSEIKSSPSNRRLAFSFYFSSRPSFTFQNFGPLIPFCFNAVQTFQQSIKNNSTT